MRCNPFPFQLWINLCRHKTLIRAITLGSKKLISKYIQSLSLISYSHGGSRHFPSGFHVMKTVSFQTQKHPNHALFTLDNAAAADLLKLEICYLRIYFSRPTWLIIFKRLESIISSSKGGNRLAAISQSANANRCHFMLLNIQICASGGSVVELDQKLSAWKTAAVVIQAHAHMLQIENCCISCIYSQSGPLIQLSLCKQQRNIMAVEDSNSIESSSAPTVCPLS